MFDPRDLPPALRCANDEALAAIEDAGLNASQPPQQLLEDGWLLRFSHGKAKRARSINAIAAGRSALEAKVAGAEAWYQRFGLPCLFRITPFSQPAGLDSYLQAQGYMAFDDTRVMSMFAGSAPAAAPSSTGTHKPVDPHRFASLVGALRSSTPEHIAAHAERLRNSPLRSSTDLVVAFDGERALAAGMCVREDRLAGLYDLVVASDQRRRGLGRALVAHLLAQARTAEAQTFYLQVDAANHAARALYAEFGFVDRYAYWYRSPPGATDPILA